MNLNEAQWLHVQLTAKLIDYAYGEGFTLSWGEAFRTQVQATWNAAHGLGIQHSLHQERLAVDLMLFRDGKYLTDPLEYKLLGEFWKSLHPLCRWGGDFKTVDADHFSITWNGVS